MNKIFLPAVFFFSFSSFAQTTFTRVLWDSLGFGVQAYSVAKAFDAGYLLAGEFSFQSGALVIKTDSAGNVLWNKKLTGSGSQKLYSITLTFDSCFVAAGRMNDMGFCTKFNALGDTLWTRAFHAGANTTSEIYSVIQTIDSGFAMTGFIYQPPYPYTKIFVIKLDKNGNTDWSQIFESGNWQNLAGTIKQTPDSGYIISGMIENGGPPFYIDAFLLKLSGSGAVSWAKKYSTASNTFCRANDIVITSSGYVSVFDIGNFMALVKTDFSGNILWMKMLGIMSSSLKNNIPSKVRETPEGDFVLMNTSLAFYMSSLIKTDSNGVFLWERFLEFYGADLLVTDDSGFFCLGNGPVMGVESQVPYSPQIGIIKTDTAGMSAQCAYPNISTIPLDTLIALPVSFISPGSMTAVQLQPATGSESFLSDQVALHFSEA